MKRKPTAAAAAVRAVALAVAALTVTPSALAGRPVYTTYTLEQLTQAADVIAVVSQLPLHERTARDALGCQRVLWRLQVHGVLKQRPAPAGRHALAPASEVEALVNPTSVRDCTLRGGGQTSGASFKAQRYTPSYEPLGASHKFLVFLSVQDETLQLAADQGWESVQRTQDVLRWLDQPAAPR
jgi:hypothetical protein